MATREVAVWTIIQARLGSTRRPAKVIADIAGKLLIERAVERAERIGYPVCVTIPLLDSELAQVCLSRDWTYVEGPEDDVLDRYRLAARTVHADHIIRVTADCPFLDVEAARWTVDHHLESGADFTTYHLAEGRGVEVFTREALEESAELAPRSVRIYREHPDEWILHNPRRYHIEWMKFSVDTPEDLEQARKRAGSTYDRFDLNER